MSGLFAKIAQPMCLDVVPTWGLVTGGVVCFVLSFCLDDAVAVAVMLWHDLCVESVTALFFVVGWCVMSCHRRGEKPWRAAHVYVNDEPAACAPGKEAGCPGVPHGVAATLQKVVSLSSARQYTQAFLLCKETMALEETWAAFATMPPAQLQAFFTAAVLAAVLPGTGRSSPGRRVINDMRKAHVARTPEFYESCLRALARKQGFAAAVEIHAEQQQDGVIPTAEAAGCLMTALVDVGNTTGALELLRELSKEQYVPSMRAYMFLLKPLHARGEWQQALEVFNDIKMRGAPLDTLCLNVILGACVRGARGEIAADIYNEQRDARSALLDVVSVNTAALGMLRSRRHVGAALAIADAAEASMELNERTFKLLCDIALKVEEAEAQQFAWALRRVALSPAAADGRNVTLLEQAAARLSSRHEGRTGAL